jgi:acetyl esterase/lipase
MLSALSARPVAQLEMHLRPTALFLLLAMAVAACAPGTPSRSDSAASGQLMTFADLQALPSLAPDQRIAYGQDSSQFGELRVPNGTGPHPVAVLVHGGCWKAAYARAAELGQMGDALEANGIASWNIEYRRLGQPGGGWPGTYLDVGHAVDHLRTLAPRYNLDLGRVVVVGHSAGGHLAMWTAARRRLPETSALYLRDPLAVRGVVNLAGRADMTVNIREYESLCRDSVVTSLLGGTPTTVPERYAQVSAKAMLPLGVPQVFVIGTHEEFVPRPLAEAYVSAAVQAGDSARLLVIPAAGHFEIASARSAAWRPIEVAIRSLLGGRLPPEDARR